MRTRAASPIDAANPMNRTHPLNRGRLAWWLACPGLAGGAKLHDLTGAGNHGTLAGALTWAGAAAGPGAGIGAGLRGFTGGATTSTYVDCGNAPAINPLLGATYLAVIVPATIGGESWVIARDDNTLGRSFAFGMRVAANQQLWLQVAGADTVSGGNLAIGVPNLIAATGSVGNGWKLHMYNGTTNGVVASVAWAAPSASTASTCLGRRTYAANQFGFTGQLIEATIYGIDLAGQIGAYYELARRRYPGLLNRVGPPVFATAAAGFKPAWAARSSLVYTSVSGAA